MELANISVVVDVNDIPAVKGLDKITAKAEGLSKKLDSGMKTAAKWGAVLGAAAVAAGVGLLKVANSAAAATDRIDKMSLKLGMSRKGFQEWDYVLSQNGASIDSMKAGMVKLNTVFDEASAGSETATDTFSQLGLSMDSLAGKSREEIFNMTITALQNMTDESKKAALTTKLLGKAGVEMAPMLASGAAGVAELKARAHELGLVLGDEAIDAGVVFGDTMDDVKGALSSLVTQIGVKVMPMIKKGLDYIIAHLPQIKKAMSDAFVFVGGAIEAATPVFKTLIAIIKVLAEVLKPLMPIIKPLLPLLIGLGVGVGIFGAISKAVLFFTGMAGTASGALTVLSAAFVFITGPVGLAIAAIAAIIAIGYAVVKNWDGIKTAAKNLWNGITGIFNGIGESIKAPFRAAIEFIQGGIGKIKGFFSSLNPFSNQDVEMNATQKVNVERFATGGVMENPTIFARKGNTAYQGGEAGSEGIIPLQGTHMLPMAEAIAEILAQREATTASPVQNYFNIAKMDVKQESDIKKVAKELYQLQIQKNRAKGRG